MASDDSPPEGVVSLIERLRAGSAGVALRRVRIFIIDDQQVGQRVLNELVQKLGRDLEVHIFNGAREALAAVGDTPPDLVLTDYQMPEMDGIAFIRAFRRVPGCEDVPVVVVTVAEERRVRYEALEAGATDFLRRPVDHHECIARCRNLLLLRDQQILIRQRARLLEEAVAGRGRRAAARVGGEPEAGVVTATEERRLAPPPDSGLELERVPINLRTLAAEIVRFFCPGVDAPGLATVIQIGPEVPERVWGDLRYLRYLLVNLVGDATEFAHDGALRVTVQTVARDPREVRLRFEVSIIPPEAAAEPEKVHCPQSLRRRQDDHGPDVGLCERLVTLLGGRYGRECGAHRRATWFTLTLAVDNRLLLVTGEALATRLGSWLTGWGLPWERATGVADALHRLVAQRAANEPYRFVVVEEAALGLPTETFPAMLAHDPVLASATLLLIAATGGEAAAEQARRVGYGAVLTEPLERGALFNVLAGGLERGAEAVQSLAPTRLPRRLRRRVLVASETPRTRARLRRALEAAGHRVEGVADLEELLDRLADADFDLLVIGEASEVERLLIAFHFVGEGRPPPVVALASGTLTRAGDPALAAVTWIPEGASDEALREAVARVLALEGR
jgi:CheY-like chemotaxis protein